MFKFGIKIFALLVIQAFTKGQAIKSSTAEVVMEVILSDHKRDIREVNFIVDRKIEKYSREFNDFIDDNFSAIGSRMSVRWVNLTQHHSSDKTQRFFFNVLLIGSLDMFHNQLKKISSRSFDFGGFYFIIFEKASLADMDEIFTSLWSFYIYNVIVASYSSENNSVSLHTFVPFSENGCNKTNPIKINEFINGSFLRKPSGFFRNKLRNLHGCKIKVSTFENFGPSVLKESFANGSSTIYGRDMDIIDALGNELNFTPVTSYLETYGSWGILNANNGTATGAMGQAIRRETDFILGNILLKLERSIFMDYSNPYYIDQLIITIPPGRAFTSFEKLVRPFNIIVWICFGVIIFCSFVVITILQFQSKKAKEYFYGKNVANPYLNVLIAVFGGSQKSLPKKDFPRYLLMLFLLYCLVMRSLYTASLFLFLQSNDHEKEPQTIIEMAERDYTFYMIISYKDLTEDSIPMLGRRIFIKPDEVGPILNKTLDPTFKGGIMVTLSKILYMNQLHFKEYSFYICKERYTMFPVVIYFPKNSFLKDEFDKKLLDFQELGFIEHWSSAHVDMKYLNFHPRTSGPKQLSLRHLSGTVQMYIAGLIASIIMVFIEKLRFHIRQSKLCNYF